MTNKLPNFICVGAQKAGTTSLHDILSQDSQLYLPKIKETKFFQLDSKYNQGIKYYKEEYFNDLQDNQIIGEIDPDYMYFNYVPKRIYDTLGNDVKLIFILRNPVKRAFSHYQMSMRRGFETLSFDEAIKVEVERIKEDDSQNEFYKSKTHNFSYIDRGYYSKQIKEFLTYFPKENMLFIIFDEDFIKNKRNTIESIYEFLKLDMPTNLNINLKSNKSTIYRLKFLTNIIYKPNILKRIAKYIIPNKYKSNLLSIVDKLNQKEVDNKYHLKEENINKLLSQYYKDELPELEKLINRDLNCWYE